MRRRKEFAHRCGDDRTVVIRVVVRVVGSRGTTGVTVITDRDRYLSIEREV